MTQDLHVVIGAGPLGSAVARTLLARGARVRVVTRGGRGLPGAETLAADVMDPAEARCAAAGAAVLFQCAQPPYHRWPEEFPRLQENLLQGAIAAGTVFVAAENLYAYGVAGDLHEALPLAARTRKGAVRARLAERLWEAHGRGEVRAVAGRASDFVGPGVRQSALGERLWPVLLAGRPVSWFGDPDAVRSFTYVPDFAAALVRLGAEERAWGRAWHVPSLAPRTPREVMGAAAAMAGLPPPRIRRTPEAVLRLAGLFIPPAREMVEMGYSFAAPFVARHDDWDAAFGDPPTPWPAALAATLASWRAGAA